MAKTSTVWGTVRFRHGSNAAADDPLLWFSGPGLLAKKWLHADRLGSIVAWTNASGGSPTINKYDEYGLPAATNTGRFQYTGQAWIGELGLYYYKARMYSPGLGRFLQTDPVGYNGGINLYGYVGGDPLNRLDPTGNDAIWVGNSDGSTTLIIPVHYAGPGATPANVAAIVNRVNSLTISDPTVHVQVIATDAPINGVLNKMDLSPGYNTSMCGSPGECVNRLGGDTAHINTDNAQWVDAGAHDTLHFSGIADQYVEGPRDAKGRRTSTINPGYENNIMGPRSGTDLRPEQVKEARSNPTTTQIKATSDWSIEAGQITGNRAQGTRICPEGEPGPC